MSTGVCSGEVWSNEKEGSIGEVSHYRMCLEICLYREVSAYGKCFLRGDVLHRGGVCLQEMSS